MGDRIPPHADADEALDVTGYVRGTITPFGATARWPVIADTRVSTGTVSIGGGAPGVSFTVDGEELCKTLDAEVADVTRTQAKD